MQCVSIVLVGLGGYGALYVNALLDAPDKGGFRIVGAVDPKPDACERLDELKVGGVALYASLDDFYKANRADLAIISTPIQFHASQTCLALSHGSHVLCEKPLCATAENAWRVVHASSQAGRFVAVGFQRAFSDAMLRVKSDILNGVFGRPLRMKAIVLWPRDTKYFQRGWAGRKYTNDGLCVFDSIANNACAHYLHNMLYVLGDSMAESAMPQSVIAELYKANPIENFDTIALRMETRACSDMIFLASHAVNDRRNPTFQYSFEKAELLSSDELTCGNVVAVFRDGRRVDYGAPSGEDTAKLWNSIDAVRTGAAPSCVAMTALPHTLCIDAVQRSVPDILAFPRKMVHTDDNGVVYAEGMAQILWESYEAGLLPSERAVPWAKAGTKCSLCDSLHQ